MQIHSDFQDSFRLIKPLLQPIQIQTFQNIIQTIEYLIYFFFLFIGNLLNLQHAAVHKGESFLF